MPVLSPARQAVQAPPGGDQEGERSSAAPIRQAGVHRLSPAAQRAEIRPLPLQPGQPQKALHKPFASGIEPVPPSLVHSSAGASRTELSKSGRSEPRHRRSAAAGSVCHAAAVFKSSRDQTGPARARAASAHQCNPAGSSSCRPWGSNCSCRQATMLETRHESHQEICAACITALCARGFGSNLARCRVLTCIRHRDAVIVMPRARMVFAGRNQIKAACSMALCRTLVLPAPSYDRCVKRLSALLRSDGLATAGGPYAAMAGAR